MSGSGADYLERESNKTCIPDKTTKQSSEVTTIYQMNDVVGAEQKE